MFSRYEVNGEALGDTRVKHRRVPGLVTRNLLKPRRMQVRLYRIAGVTSDGGRGVGDDPPKDDTEVELMHQDAHCRTQRIADSLDVRHAGVVREEYWVDCMVVAIEKHTGMFEVEVDSHLELGVAKYNRKVGRATVDPWTAGMTRQDGVGHSLVGVLHALRSDLRQGQPRYQHLLGKPWGVAVFAPGEVGRVMDGSSVVVADQEKVRRGGRGSREERERREGRMCVCGVLLVYANSYLPSLACHLLSHLSSELSTHLSQYTRRQEQSRAPVQGQIRIRSYDWDVRFAAGRAARTTGNMYRLRRTDHSRRHV